MIRKSAILAGSLALSLQWGCSGGGSTPTPTPSKSVASANATAAPATGSASPSGTESPASTASPDVNPHAKPAEVKEYEKLKNEGISKTLGKGYDEAIPILEECLKKRTDDPEVYFYLMLAHGSKEEEPTADSEAYKNAEKVIELAPQDTMAERANDYIISSKSEPAKPLPDKEGTPLFNLKSAPKFETRTAYALAVPVNLYETRDNAMTLDLRKKLWYLEVKPDVIKDKIALPKGTKISIQSWDSSWYSKNGWRGGEALRGKDFPPEPDTNCFAFGAYRVTVQDGPNKGKQGWFVSQFDRYKGRDEDGEPVWGVKVPPRFVVAD